MSHIIIDVRNKSEYLLGHLKGAINIPLDQVPLHYPFFSKNDNISLICQSGVRAKQAAKMLNDEGFFNISLTPLHYEAIDEYELVKGLNRWSVDRQFRMTLGVLLFIFLLGYIYVSKYFLVIPLVLCTGLIVTSIIDRFYMRIAIAKMPWNNVGRNTKL